MAKAAKGLTITQRPNGSWRAQIRKTGYPYESRDFLTHDAADEWGLRRLDEIRKTGRLIDRREAERTTLKAAITAYLVEVTDKRPGEPSRKSERARLARFMRVEEKLCGHALAHLTPEMFEAWRDRRLLQPALRGVEGGRGRYKSEIVPLKRFNKDGKPRANAAKIKAPPKPQKTIAPGTVKREMTLLKRIFDFSMRRYKLVSNPLDKSLVERPAVSDERDVRLDESDWTRLLDMCRESTNPWLAPFVEIGVEIGARRGSMMALLWSDIDLEGCRATLRGVKNSRNPSEVRTVEIGLSPRAVELLSALPRSEMDDRVFRTTHDAITGAFNRARAKVSLGQFRIHDSRHELASRLVENGWGLLDVMAQGDWRDPKSVKRYYTARGSHLGAKLAGLRRTPSDAS